jgi:hypothetical protein
MCESYRRLRITSSVFRIQDSATSFPSPSLGELAARPSWFRLLAKHRCGLRILAARCAGILLPAANEKRPFGRFFVIAGRLGLEPCGAKPTLAVLLSLGLSQRRVSGTLKK